MGNCTCDFNKKYKTQNNYNPTLSNPNIIPNNGNQKINEFNKSSSSLPIPETEEVYKISRKRKTQNRIIKKQLKFNTVNSFTSYNSTLSKTKNTTTDVSDNKLSFKGANNHNYKFNLNSRIKTIYEKNSEYSDTLPSVSNNLNSENNSSQYDYNKKFIETKTKIRKKIHSKDKSLQIIPEEVNKINNQKLKEKNMINNNGITFLNKNYFKCFKTISGHEDKIVCITELSSGKIATGSYDNKIKIWNLSSYNEEKTIKEEGNVLCLLEFENGMLLSGTNKNNINLFDLNNNLNNNKIFSFKGHQLWVNNLVKINNNYFASCSNDNNIIIWDYKNKLCSYILKGHLDCVLSIILLSNGKLCSGGADLSIKIWDLNSGECCATLLGHKKWIKCLCQLTNNFIISGSDDKKIKVWLNNKCVKNLEGHTKSVRTLCQINSYFFASGSFDKSIKIWDIFNFSCVQTIYGHKDLILNIIRSNNGDIISCSNDHEIKFWKQITI